MAMFTIDVNLNFPQAVLDFCAAALDRHTAAHPIEEVSHFDGPDPLPEAAPQAKAAVQTEATAPQLTLTDVRSTLAPLLKAGRKDEVQGLFQKYGAAKLSEVKPADYAALMRDAEAL